MGPVRGIINIRNHVESSHKCIQHNTSGARLCIHSTSGNKITAMCWKANEGIHRLSCVKGRTNFALSNPMYDFGGPEKEKVVFCLFPHERET